MQAYYSLCLTEGKGGELSLVIIWQAIAIADWTQEAFHGLCELYASLHGHSTSQYV